MTDREQLKKLLVALKTLLADLQDYLRGDYKDQPDHQQNGLSTGIRRPQLGTNSVEE